MKFELAIFIHDEHVYHFIIIWNQIQSFILLVFNCYYFFLKLILNYFNLIILPGVNLNFLPKFKIILAFFLNILIKILI